MKFCANISAVERIALLRNQELARSSLLETGSWKLVDCIADTLVTSKVCLGQGVLAGQDFCPCCNKYIYYDFMFTGVYP